MCVCGLDGSGVKKRDLLWIVMRTSARGGHSYSTRRTVRDRGQDAVKRSSRIFSTGQAVKRTFWVGQRSRPTFAQTNSYSTSYPTGSTLYTVYLSRLTSKLPAHALVQTGLTFHPFWNRTPSFILNARYSKMCARANSRKRGRGWDIIRIALCSVKPRRARAEKGVYCTCLRPCTGPPDYEINYSSVWITLDAVLGENNSCV